MEKTISFAPSIMVTNVGDNAKITHLGEYKPDVQNVTIDNISFKKIMKKSCHITHVI